MAATISRLDFLSAEEQGYLHTMLKRIIQQLPGSVIELSPSTPEEGHIYLLTTDRARRSFDPNDPSPDLEEFRRRLAHPEEFVEFEEFEITTKSH